MDTFIILAIIGITMAVVALGLATLTLIRVHKNNTQPALTRDTTQP